MSRNMKEANIKIFDRLINFTDEFTDETSRVQKGKRYIKTDEKEKIWLKELKIKSQQSILPRLKTSTAKFNDNDYFIIVGWDSRTINGIDNAFEIEELNAGLATALISELEIPIRQHIDPLVIVNSLNSQSEEAMPDEYNGHDYKDIANLFDSFGVFRILDECPINSDNIIRLSCLFVSQNRQNLILPFEDETIKTFDDIIQTGSNSIPFENFLLSQTSFSWKYAFLDIYRCIEKIFIIPFFKEIFDHNTLVPKPDFKAFVNLVKGKTGWLPKEDIAILKMIKNAPPFILDELEKLIKLKNNQVNLNNEREQHLASWFYKVRNSIVHYRLGEDEIRFDDIEWNMLLRIALNLTKFAYSYCEVEVEKLMT